MDRLIEPDTVLIVNVHLRGEKPSLSKLAEDDLRLAEFIKSTIRQKLGDKSFSDLINTWFGEFFSKYQSHFEFDNPGQYWDYLRKNNIRSLNRHSPSGMLADVKKA